MALLDSRSVGIQGAPCFGSKHMALQGFVPITEPFTVDPGVESCTEGSSGETLVSGQTPETCTDGPNIGTVVDGLTRNTCADGTNGLTNATGVERLTCTEMFAAESTLAVTTPVLTCTESVASDTVTAGVQPGTSTDADDT